MKHVLMIAAALATLGQPAAAQDGARIQRGYAINPVPLDMTGKNPAKVGLGSYLINATGGCNDCHTNPPYAAGGDPFLGQPTRVNVDGYLAGGVAFGPFVSRNLTPDANGRPAGLTLEQFLFVLNTGTDVKGVPPLVPSQENDLLQVMPWPVHRNMLRKDKEAIYEYLRAIPCRGSAERCGR
jgi:hypothetical protein